MKKGWTSRIIILLVIGLNVWFANKTLNVFAATGVEPVATVAAFFSFTTGELWALTYIKKLKLKRKENLQDDAQANDCEESHEP